MTADRDVQQQLLPTPWVGSWVGRARPGDLHDPDLGRRAAAWAHWAVDGLTQMTGLYDRSYYALRLPGRFYDPRGTMPKIRPHLEVSSRVLDRVDAELPDRLALAGNGLMFQWWVRSEVTALRRSLFNVRRGSLGDLVALLGSRRGSLVRAVTDLNAAAHPNWAVIEGLLVSSPDGLAPDAAGDFSADEVAGFFPAAAELELEVSYDAKLRDSNGVWASRRVGVWQVRGRNGDGEPFSFGVVTPRLTAGSLFKDPLFRPQTESAASLLVRGLLLRRLVRNYLSYDEDTRVDDRRDLAALTGPGQPHLRAVPSRVGAKLPQASVESAVLFVQTFPNADEAWEALSSWAGADHLLTVTQESFVASHGNAARFIRRAETPERDDIDVILPLAWDVSGSESRVVRVTFAKGRGAAD